ncbi:peptidase family m13 domain-containing protein [Ditylenchus destructor]|uniref:Peptidase family m13 domain-containing protein n=1 Tax=Ditylenchus destructor TaxID=166010 RepID=A0AAD4QWZ4_9BILA|nr:peptidase family m13 domain-containing protein [Ditylenchus destructor]
MKVTCPKTCGYCDETNEYELGKRKPNIVTNSQDLFDFPELSTSLNRDIDPCEDFYHHVCDGFQKAHDPSVSPSNAGRINQYDLVDMEIERRIFSLLETRRDNQNQDPYVEQMFTFYDTCMNQEKRLREKSTYLLSKLASMKASPAARVSYTADWLISAYPYSVLYNYYIQRDLNNASQNIVYFGPMYDVNMFNTQKDMFPIHYLKPEHEERRINYKNYLSRVLRLLMDDDMENKAFPKENSEEEIRRRVDNYMAVETERRKIMSNMKGINYNNPYDIYTFASLGEFVDKGFSPKSMDWTQYFKAFMPQPPRAQGASNDMYSMSVAVEEFESFIPLAVLIDGLDPQQLSDYLEWRIIMIHLPFLDQRFFEGRLKFIGAPVDQRWLCKQQTIRYFLHQVDKLYIEQYYNEEKDQPVIETMRHYMDESFREIIQESDWMDDNTKAKALEKLDLMEVHIGYVSDIYDRDLLDKRYGLATLTEEMSFPEMIWTLDKREMDYLMGTMAEKGHLYYWYSLEANTYYHWWYNSMFIQAGFLQTPLYDSEFPDALKYGGLGHMFAHEYIHGYDTRGHQQNGYGELKNWWDEETKAKYNERKQCLIDQYSAVMVQIDENTTLAIDGVLTQGENIADQGGMRIAYNAFQKYLTDSSRGIEASVESNLMKVRGLEDYNDVQLFFVGSAFVRYCNSAFIYTTKGSWMRLSRNNHE